MTDLRALVRAGLRMLPGEEAVLATVVDVEGSSYRRPGARLLIGPRGERTGLVSGGCLEKDLVQRAFHLTEDGPRVVSYDTRADDEDYADDPEAGYGLGCNGVIHVLLQRVVPVRPESSPWSSPVLVDPFAVLDRPSAEDAVIQLATVYRSQDGAEASVGDCVRVDGGSLSEQSSLPSWVRQVTGSSQLQGVYPLCVRVDMHGGSLDVLLEEIEPPPRLVVFGAGDDAVPLVEMAAGMGWRVAVVDHRRGYAESERFPGAEVLLHGKPEAALAKFEIDEMTSIVCMTHSLAADAEAVRSVRSRPHAYLGVLGPSHRTARVLERAAVEPGGLRSPVGLDLGAEGPAEIALSILAEVVACRRGRSGGTLTDRPGPIHPPTARSVAPEAGDAAPTTQRPPT